MTIRGMIITMIIYKINDNINNDDNNDNNNYDGNDNNNNKKWSINNNCSQYKDYPYYYYCLVTIMNNYNTS